MLRPIPISHYLSVMRSKGYRDVDLIAGTAIDPAALANPDYLIDRADYQMFVRNMIRLSGDHGLGIELGMTWKVPKFGILAYAAQSCRTIREGVQDIWCRYSGAFGVATRLNVIAEDVDIVVLEISAPQVDEAIYRFSIEEAICSLLKIGGALTGDFSPFQALTFSYPEPSYSRRYREIFSCPVTFHGHITSVSIYRSWLDRPLETNDPELNRACQSYLERMLRQTEMASPVMLRLRDLLFDRVDAMPTIEEAARTLGFSSRTLARKLQEQGYTYQRLADEARFEVTQRWLSSENMAPKEIAFRLGFSDVGVFRRAFKNWTGLTVGQYRAQPSGKPCSPIRKPMLKRPDKR